MNRYICIHGHFYQPPRENAWLEEVELQDSAYPYHDWNQRITAEGYAPNTASRIVDSERRIIDIVNNYSHISFNVGPTLLEWMEKKEPEVYQAILRADQESQKFFSGHGAAIAQAYNHLIMPLANSRDKLTQVLWGLRDFEKRFERKPEGMWLPETAVDTETLEILAQHGMKFTILSPYQAAKMRRIGEEEWTEVSGGRVDPKMPYLCNLPSGNSIALFFYDGPISQDIGFGPLLDSGENFANRLLAAFVDEDRPQLVNIATDGETYGHHHRFGDMALAWCLYLIQSRDAAKITIYGEYLEENPPEYEAEIIENSSWSCVHGVERWRNDCGCNTGLHGGWQQKWRKPLREALDWLRDQLIPIYEDDLGAFMDDPWKARDDYIDVILDRTESNVLRFIRERVGRETTLEETSRMLKLLCMQRHAMLMYTSCGWFFDEISGIETTQILQYAARAMQLAQELTGEDFEPEFIKKLKEAPSNIQKFKNGGKVYEKFIQPAKLDLLRVGAHYAISSLFEEYPQSLRLYCYEARSHLYDRVKTGKLSLSTGQAEIFSTITWEKDEITFAALHLGGHLVNGAVRQFRSNEEFAKMEKPIKQAFLEGNIPEVIRLMDHQFGASTYTLWHLFKDERQKVFNTILQSTMEDIEIYYRRIYEDTYPLLQAMVSAQIPFPDALKTPLSLTLNTDLLKALETDDIDVDHLKEVIHEYVKWGVTPDQNRLSFVIGQRVNSLLKRLEESPQNLAQMKRIHGVLEALEELPVQGNYWVAQNIYFTLGKNHYEKRLTRAEKGDDISKQWVELFNQLGERLQVRVA